MRFWVHDIIYFVYKTSISADTFILTIFLKESEVSMFQDFYAYGNTAGAINSLETDEDIKVFLSKYKQWYVKERHLSKDEAERQIKNDIRYFLDKFNIKKNLVFKFSKIFNM